MTTEQMPGLGHVGLPARAGPDTLTLSIHFHHVLKSMFPKEGKSYQRQIHDWHLRACICVHDKVMNLYANITSIGNAFAKHSIFRMGKKALKINFDFKPDFGIWEAESIVTSGLNLFFPLLLLFGL